VTYLTKAAIPTIEIDYLLNFTTSLPFLLLLLALTQQPTFKGYFRECVRGPLILSHSSSFPVLSASLPTPPDTLTKLYIATDACDRSEFIRHLGHSKPNLRILEIGAGTGASTVSMLKYLALPGPTGQALYSKYTFTDISSAFFVSAKDLFKRNRNIEYRTLDISKDPAEQGFNGEKYDLVIATNVIHATKSLSESLRNVHKLLAPSGRLLLHELFSPSKWPNFIFGTLPGW
jgi:SAM-dependent methyltransferase